MKILGICIILITIYSCSLTRSTIDKQVYSDSIRIYTDTSSTKIVGADTIRYRSSRVITRQKKPIKIGTHEMTIMGLLIGIALFLLVKT